MNANLSMIQHHRADLDGLRMHFVEAGKGPAVILLHGFPETWYAWRYQIAPLAQNYRLIVPDLRGYGATDKPASGYDKRTMANDIRRLMQHLGIQKATIIGHDRGARVGTRFVKDHPEVVERFAALDNIPTKVIFDTKKAAFAQFGWFFLFHSVPHLPQALIQGREEMWLRFLFGDWTYNPEALSDADIAVYTQAYAQPGGCMALLPTIAPGVRISSRITPMRTRGSHAPRWHCGEPNSLERKLWTWRSSGTTWLQILRLHPSRSQAICHTKSSPNK